MDVPVPSLMRLPPSLRLHRPDQRLHLTQDTFAVRRLLIAQRRQHPLEGIVDCYLLGEDLTLLLGDLTTRSFPTQQVPSLAGMSLAERARFQIDQDGSFLYWPEHDLHLGASQLLQMVDPGYRADVVMERYSRDFSGAAIAQMREARKLRQADIEGLSERQVRRIEQGISQLTAGAAFRFAAAFDLSFRNFLDDMAKRAAAIRAEAESDRPPGTRREAPASSASLSPGRSHEPAARLHEHTRGKLDLPENPL
jgi:transcriptional regulator with XRE-family HTH domain